MTLDWTRPVGAAQNIDTTHTQTLNVWYIDLHLP